MFADFTGKNVLLLQGPLGPFFRRLADELEENGARVIKVNFCGGDLAFYHRGERVSYRDGLSEWPTYAEQLINRDQIDAIFLLGDMRPYHRPVIAIAERLGVELYVFEEGYLRPHHVTLEKGGVNGNSSMSRDPDLYRAAGKSPRKELESVGRVIWPLFFYTATYYVAIALFWPFYPRYRHHRQAFFLYHGVRFLRNGWRILKFRFTEAGMTEKIVAEGARPYYLYPLQVHNDYQILHSPYQQIEECIEEVVASFAQHADKDHVLVIKHHPADRPYREYGRLLAGLARQYDIQDRLIYVHDSHLPTLLKHAQGTVVMNSTVGLSSIHHDTPTKVLGTAIYNIEGLTFQGSLDAFWKNPGRVDADLYFSYRGWLENNNQAVGNFYRRLPSRKTGSGLRWFPVEESTAHRSGEDHGSPDDPVRDVTKKASA